MRFLAGYNVDLLFPDPRKKQSSELTYGPGGRLSVFVLAMTDQSVADLLFCTSKSCIAIGLWSSM